MVMVRGGRPGGFLHKTSPLAQPLKDVIEILLNFLNKGCLPGLFQNGLLLFAFSTQFPDRSRHGSSELNKVWFDQALVHLMGYVTLQASRKERI